MGSRPCQGAETWPLLAIDWCANMTGSLVAGLGRLRLAAAYHIRGPSLEAMWELEESKGTRRFLSRGCGGGSNVPRGRYAGPNITMISCG